ncbi:MULTISPECIES: response regulator transcription factor [Clostridium]|uniref:response regulator transcription factor n=1 Tax=Clostridium TaxID=1485 RepID=UPI000C07C423|nr:MULTISPECIES: response regulator transcription factor [Clostridium]MDU1969430.1 response regulator transcription factor [Clostridium perfringens]MDU3324107.1 response regulator transcription factor [Escherichia coli]MBS7132367.1 response regulator transcription factor [Clostridium sp.]MDB2084445.1 response regulator transcription factor [Clostridium paraputrificum]MDB2117216.1 response regulator transcription factor [Clostridium paraputrificum]
MNILLVEDDITLAMGIEYSLKNEGFNVYTVGKIKDAKEKISNSHIDIILLDVNLPDGNGYELCKEVRVDSEVPIIFLTACDEEVNIVMGLDLGADDYITKPVRVRELVARINAVARRKGVVSKDKEDNKIIVRDIKVLPLKYEVYKGDEKLQLTSVEYKLLLLLIENSGNVLTRKTLLEKLWDIEGDFIEESTLTVYIKRLREKLKEDKENPYIETVRGIGYKWIGEK